MSLDSSQRDRYVSEIRDVNSKIIGITKSFVALFLAFFAYISFGLTSLSKMSMGREAPAASGQPAVPTAAMPTASTKVGGPSALTDGKQDKVTPSLFFLGGKLYSVVGLIFVCLITTVFFYCLLQLASSKRHRFRYWRQIDALQAEQQLVMFPSDAHRPHASGYTRWFGAVAAGFFWVTMSASILILVVAWHLPAISAIQASYDREIVPLLEKVSNGDDFVMTRKEASTLGKGRGH